LAQFPSGTSAWIENIYQELAPTHGRMGGALRTAIAATIATFLLLALRAPLMPPAVYLIFLVSYDAAYLTFQNSVFQLTFQCVGVGAALSLVQVTGNDPMARVLGIALFTFFSAFFLRASTRPPAAMNFGIFSILTLSLFEQHLPAEHLVHLAMWPIGGGALAVGCKIVIEYLFTNRDPQRALQKEMDARLDALEQLFRQYAEDAPEEDIERKALAVRRYAFSGQGKMHALLEEINMHPAADTSACIIPPSLIPAIARLLDLGAAFSTHNSSNGSDSDQARFQRLATAFAAVRTGRIDDVESLLKKTPETATGLRGLIEQSLYNIGATSHAGQVLSHEGLLKPLPNRRSDSWLRRDAWTNPAYLVYAIKLSLCATICYVIYNALAWPGISTAVLTVLVAGLTTTGATNQKMLFRIVGAAVGGLIFGIGCIVFVFPYADTAIPILLTVACISFLGAWIARSAHYGYVGLQIVFAFYLTAFEGFSAPTQMAPARDRFIGILLALIVMWMIFHQLHPERTVDKMRHGLARLLTIEADLMSALRVARLDRIPALRQEADELLGSLRALGEVVPYEIDDAIQRDRKISEQIQNAASTAASVFLTAVTWPHTLSNSVKMADDTHTVLEQGLRDLSGSLEGATIHSVSEGFSTGLPQMESHDACPEPIQNTVRFFRELQNQCRAISEGFAMGGWQI
jgi:multidrug resistance protein MdtO